jgi:hypothetical protein
LWLLSSTGPVRKLERVPEYQGRIDPEGSFRRARGSGQRTSCETIGV